MNYRIYFVRLPDINSYTALDRYGYRTYGRFAILRDGSLWVGDLHSSHPQDTEVGWYWAVSGENKLLISPRGSKIDNNLLLDSQYNFTGLLISALKKMRVIL
jgi:hypothetical protein